MGTSQLKSPHIFNAARTDDIRQAIKHITAKFPRSPLLAAAYSMGANVLTKYLGEEKDNCKLLGAVCVSNPFDLNDISEKAKNCLRTRFYGKILTNDLQNYVKRHREVLKDTLDFNAALQSKSLWEFDEKVTIKINNFASLHEYYERASCLHKLKEVTIPVLFLNSMDDPIVPGTVVPYQMANENPNLLFALTERGGHTAFLKNIKWWTRAWSDDVIEEFLSAVINRSIQVPSSPVMREEMPLLAK